MMDAQTLIQLFTDSFLSYFILPTKTEVLWFSMLSFGQDMLLPTVIAFTGSILGFMASYGVGFLGRKYAPALPVESPKFQKLHRIFTKYLIWVLAIAWIPFLPVLALILGFLREQWWWVFIISAAGRILYYINYVAV